MHLQHVAILEVAALQGLDALGGELTAGTVGVREGGRGLGGGLGGVLCLDLVDAVHGQGAVARLVLHRHLEGVGGGVVRDAVPALEILGDGIVEGLFRLVVQVGQAVGDLVEPEVRTGRTLGQRHAPGGGAGQRGGFVLDGIRSDGHRQGVARGESAACDGLLALGNEYTGGIVLVGYGGFAVLAAGLGDLQRSVALVLHGDGDGVLGLDGRGATHGDRGLGDGVMEGLFRRPAEVGQFIGHLIEAEIIAFIARGGGDIHARRVGQLAAVGAGDGHRQRIARHKLAALDLLLAFEGGVAGGVVGVGEGHLIDGDRRPLFPGLRGTGDGGIAHQVAGLRIAHNSDGDGVLGLVVGNAAQVAFGLLDGIRVGAGILDFDCAKVDRLTHVGDGGRQAGGVHLGLGIGVAWGHGEVELAVVERAAGQGLLRGQRHGVVGILHVGGCPLVVLLDGLDGEASGGRDGVVQRPDLLAHGCISGLVHDEVVLLIRRRQQVALGGLDLFPVVQGIVSHRLEGDLALRISLVRLDKGIAGNRVGAGIVGQLVQLEPGPLQRLSDVVLVDLAQLDSIVRTGDGAGVLDDGVLLGDGILKGTAALQDRSVGEILLHTSAGQLLHPHLEGDSDGFGIGDGDGQVATVVVVAHLVIVSACNHDGVGDQLHVGGNAVP